MKNGKIFGKINIFDFIVIVLVVLLIFAAVMFFGFKSNNTDGTTLKEMTYEIQVKTVREETVSGFSVGQNVYENTSKKQIGVITAIKSEDAVKEFETFDGRVIDAPVEGRKDLTLSILCVVKHKDGGDYWLNSDNRLLEGSDITFITQKNKCFGNIKNVTEVSDLGLLFGSFQSASDAFYSERAGQ